MFLYSLLFLFLNIFCTTSTPRGAEIRITNSGMQYGASVGVRKLQNELRNKRLGSFSGHNGPVRWGAQDIVLQYINVPSYQVAPIPNVGFFVKFSGISTALRMRVHYRAGHGWLSVGDTTNADIKGHAIDFQVNVKLDARAGKPRLQTTGCWANVRNINLRFSGGLAWVYNIISGIIVNKLKKPISDLLCQKGQEVINRDANLFLYKFPVTRRIEELASIDYAFLKPELNHGFIDFLLRGEFLDPKHPVRSNSNPPDFDTINAANRMLYIWVSDWTVNTAATVLYKAGKLRLQVTSKDKFIPPFVRPFLSTKIFKDIIPEIYDKFPNTSLQFKVSCFKAPEVNLGAGNGELVLFNRLAIEVDNAGNVSKLFYVDLTINTKGHVNLFNRNNLLHVRGKITSFVFNAVVSGSLIGDVEFPVGDKKINELIQGLIIESANVVLSHGFTLPSIPDLNFINPTVTIVKNAVRIDTDIRYYG